MNKKQEVSSKELIFNSLRLKAEELLLRNNSDKSVHLNNEVSVLINELEIYELELEMQNDELKSSYHTLELERLKFAGIFNNAPIGYAILNHNATILDCNQVGLTMLEHPLEYFSGQILATFIHPEDRALFYAFFSKVKISEERSTCELRFKNKASQVSFVQLDAISILNSETNEKTFYVTLIDLTEAKKAQQRLNETTERLNQTLEASCTGTWKFQIEDGLVFLDGFSWQILEVKKQESSYSVDQMLELFTESDREKILAIALEKNYKAEIDLDLHLKRDGGSIKTILTKGKYFEPLNEPKYFTGILIDVSERKKVLEREEQEKFSRELLLKRASVEAQEKEREKISSALHDSVCQLLYGIGFKINRIQKDEIKDSSFSDINALLDQAIRELRTISVNLNPTVLKDFGFNAGMLDMVQRLKQSDFKVSANIDQKIDLLPAETQLSMFRIIQELINNSIKHSGANAAKVVVHAEEKQIVIRVSDKGVGLPFDIEQEQKKGSGLRGIKYRVLLLNGILEITNKGGANFEITFPKSN